MPDTPHLKNGMYAILHRYPDGHFGNTADGNGSENSYSKMIRGVCSGHRGGGVCRIPPHPGAGGVCADFFQNGWGVYRIPPICSLIRFLRIRAAFGEIIIASARGDLGRTTRFFEAVAGFANSVKAMRVCPHFRYSLRHTS